MEYIKQSMNDIWAAAGDVVMPDPVKITEGWLVEVPPRQYWNWMQNRTDVNLAYIFQRGVPEWDISVEYLANKSFVVHNGVVYKCILTGVGKNPESQPTYWVRAFRDWSAIGQAVDNLTPAADRFVYYTGASTAALATVTSFARSILDDTSAADVRTTIGAQASDATLTAVAGVTTAANKLIYFTGVDTAATTDLSAFGRSLIDDADASAARTTLGLASGATTTVGTIATQNANSVSITGGSITGITDLAITDGGTGASTAADARTNLGLGNAATATVQSSATDNTAGALMAVGAFGLGSYSVDVGPADANAITANGMYYSSAWTNGWYTFGHLVHIAISPDYVVQTFYGATQTTKGQAFRIKDGGTWSAWQSIFHTGNILGPVSQSGGIPTGAIIERGSNANGEYVRFADGTQICTSTLLSAGSVNEPIGYAFRTGEIVWNFPVAFAQRPITSGIEFAGVGNCWVTRGDSGAESANSSSYRIYRSSGADLAPFARFIAIGRWY